MWIPDCHTGDAGGQVPTTDTEHEEREDVTMSQRSLCRGKDEDEWPKLLHTAPQQQVTESSSIPSTVDEDPKERGHCHGTLWNIEQHVVHKFMNHVRTSSHYNNSRGGPPLVHCQSLCLEVEFVGIV